MKIVEPNVELWRQGTDVEKHIARCARICYKSLKDTGNDKLVANLKKSGHNSMFRHESVYAIIPDDEIVLAFFAHYVECPYIDFNKYDDKIYVATNGNFILDLYDSFDYDKIRIYRYITENQVDENQFANTEMGHTLMRYTFKVVTQISTSRELNRVSPNNIAEQSTRYVLEEGCICRPWWMTDEDINIYNGSCNNITSSKFHIYINACEKGFNHYKELIKEDMLREDARGVLPLDTATTCAYTYSIKEWRKIIDLRYYGTTGKPHNNARIIAGMIKEELEQLGYEFKD